MIAFSPLRTDRDRIKLILYTILMDSYIPRRTRTIKDGFRSVIDPSRERVGKRCAIHCSKVTKGGDYLTEGSMYVLRPLGNYCIARRKRSGVSCRQGLSLVVL